MNKISSHIIPALLFFLKRLLVVVVGFLFWGLTNVADPIDLKAKLSLMKKGEIIFFACLLLFLFVIVLSSLWTTNRSWPGFPMLGFSLLHMISTIYIISHLKDYLIWSYIFDLACIFDIVIFWSVARTLYRRKNLAPHM